MSNVNKVKLLSERTSGVPPVIFYKSLLKALGPDNAKSQYLHLHKYSLLCVLRFTLKLYAWKDAY